MYNSKKLSTKRGYVSINLPEGKFFHPNDKKCKHDLICILQNHFLDEVKQLQLISPNKLEEFRYLCESYFDNLNETEEEFFEEDEYERYL